MKSVAEKQPALQEAREKKATLLLSLTSRRLYRDLSVETGRVKGDDDGLPVCACTCVSMQACVVFVLSVCGCERSHRWMVPEVFMYLCMSVNLLSG